MATLLEKLEATTRTTIAAAGPRYSPALDPDAPNLSITELVNALSALALSGAARDRARSLATGLREAAKRADHTLDRELAGISTTPAAIADELERLAGQKTAADVKSTTSRLRQHLRIASRCLERREDGLDKRLDALRAIPDDQVTEDDKRSRESLRIQTNDIRSVRFALAEIEDWASGPEGQLLVDRQSALLLGPWGSGKTHFVCDFALTAAEEQIPAVAVLATALRDDIEPLDALSEAIGVGKNGADLAAKLDRAGRHVGRRALIMIDAINEADREAWRRRLVRLTRSIDHYEHLGVVLTCRTPFNQGIVTSAASRNIVILQHPGFEGQEFDAQQEFFAHYQLPAPHVPLLTPEFSRPLFLRLLCEAFTKLSTKSKHKQLNDIASGQKGMTYVLEYFARSVGDRVEKSHGLSGLTCWRLMKGVVGKGHMGFAGRMAEKRRPYLWRAEAVAEIVAQAGLTADAADAVVGDMLAEGLMAEDMRYIDGHYQAVLTFPYQRFGDHVIARHLLDRHFDATSETAVRRSLYLNRPLGAIFRLERWSNQYAEPGLAAAVMLEFPERVKRAGLNAELLFYLPKPRRLVQPFADAFLDGLAWRSSTAFTTDTEWVVDRLLSFDIPELTHDVYEALIGLAARPSHPMNADSLWRRICALQIPDRDLTWSESLRRSDDGANFRRVLAWAERSARPATPPDVASNEMRLLALGLTTTDRHLRDRCTRALVFLGEVHPGRLFALVLESLAFNDPYVSERLLAASYGVCMRRWANPEWASTHGPNVVSLAKQVLDQVLRPTGDHFTWHCLRRDYAIGIVQLARKLQPRAIPATALGSLVADAGQAPTPFRPVRRIQRAERIDGDHAIHMDFGNYTMGRLVEGRQNYDMNHGEYVEIRSQIEDRIRLLGYSKDRFEEVDRTIGRLADRQRDPGKTDRYGKKYSWIAYFEMYGLRDALGLLMDERRVHERTSDCDIDPSFPSDPWEWGAPLQDLFSTATRSHRKWLAEGPVPDYRHLLDRTEVDGVKGDWVLLDAQIREHGSHKRESIAWVSSALVPPSGLPLARSEFRRGRRMSDHGVLDSGADYYTYLGEIPWSPHFGSDVRTRTGAPRRMRERAFDYYDGRRWRPGIPVEATTRRWGWESHRSALNQVVGLEFPAPPIADWLDLRSVGAALDLVDPNGRVATLYRVTNGGGFESSYLYLRRDLLDAYLRDRNLRLVRELSGERRIDHDYLRGEVTDELRAVYQSHAHMFRFADLDGEWLSLPVDRSG